MPGRAGPSPQSPPIHALGFSSGSMGGHSVDTVALAQAAQLGTALASAPPPPTSHRGLLPPHLSPVPTVTPAGQTGSCWGRNGEAGKAIPPPRGRSTGWAAPGARAKVVPPQATEKKDGAWTTVSPWPRGNPPARTSVSNPQPPDCQRMNACPVRAHLREIRHAHCAGGKAEASRGSGEGLRGAHKWRQVESRCRQGTEAGQ